MRYTGTRMLLLPPKCGSRFCETYVDGISFMPGDIEAPIKTRSGHPPWDWCRHVPLRYVPARLREGRQVWVMSRDPFEWYESWWKHMSAQDFAYNCYWGHVLSVSYDSRTDRLHKPRNVPDFKTALHDYIFGWSNPTLVEGASKIIDIDTVWGENHLLLQSKERVGWWSHWMHYTASIRAGAWNPEARFILLDSVEDGLRAAGFTLSDEPGSRPRERVGEQAPTESDIVWDDEMTGWVDAADGPTWKLVREQGP